MFDRQQRPSDPRCVLRIVLDADGVDVLDEAGSLVVSFRWQDVKRVHSWKVDCFCYDRIELAFELASSTEPIELHEEMDGFTELIEKMQRRCEGLKADWWSSVAFPPFPRISPWCGIDRG